MRKEEKQLAKDIIELLREFNETDFKTLREAKLLSIDEHTQSARIELNHQKMTVPINMHISRLETLLEIGGYYGIKAFIDQDNQLVDYSYITDDMLVVGKTNEGVSIYE